MRLLLLEMRPRNLVQSSLRDLIGHLINKLQGQHSVVIQSDVQFDATLPEDTHLALYRIIQECLNNIVKHSEATAASIHLAVRDSRLVLSIKDNGSGFDTGELKPGLGLGIMRERAARLGATLEMNSVIGDGTEIKLSLNLADVVPASGAVSA
jgi:signal transduction histidine kinase